MEKRKIDYYRSGERYFFAWEEGEEDALIDGLISLAKNPGLEFDWLDAAIVGYKLTQSLIDQATVLLAA